MSWKLRRITGLDVLTWVVHGLIHWGGMRLFQWVEFTPHQVAALLTSGFLVWVTREEAQDSITKWDDVGDLIGPAGVTAWAWWIALTL